MSFSPADLHNANEQIAIALRRLSDQRKVIALLREHGGHTEAAEKLLASIEQVLAAFMEHRRQIEEEMGEQT
jgi:hypothetical protein